MPSTSMLAAAIKVVSLLLLSSGTVQAGVPGLQSTHVRQPASISYQARNDCPELCIVSGPNPSNWTAYHSLDQASYCQETIFYHFSIHDPVDDETQHHRLYACTSLGTTKKPGAAPVAAAFAAPIAQTVNNASFTLGRWDEQAPSNIDLTFLSTQMRRFMHDGFGAERGSPLVLFIQTVTSTAGLYVGRDVDMQSTARAALSAMENSLYSSNNTSGSFAMELCGHGYDTDHMFGFIATSNLSFTPVQQALQSWTNATCLNFNTKEYVYSTIRYTTPVVLPSNDTSASTAVTSSPSLTTVHDSSLQRRGDCRTIQVVAGDGCASLASKCKISGANFTKYNPSKTLCSSLQPKQHVCCSSGTLPNYKPKPNKDGSCAAYKIVADDNCSSLAATYSLTAAEIESFNKKTWGWSTCKILYTGSIICLSTGTPPMPATLANAQCGPQKPGTKAPSGGTANIAGLNPCPLNACCDVWGQCGITTEFCINTSTGAPGTAKPSTNGCISNCGTEIVKAKNAPSEFISLAYYEGFGLSRDCLFQDARQIDTSKSSHVHFAFAILGADYSVSTGDAYSTYEFNAFKNLRGVKRVLSFGGWAFSTSPSTYQIFRNGVTAANRLKMATSIANFIKAHNLDGVDIDWEYPGEPDIPGIPAGSDQDGANYLDFLAVLKNLLPGKTVSIAAPASYWYLKAFPISQISKIVDYIVFMTYDLHGQWDAGNKFSQEGCSSGNCLRSHVNLTETNTALAMITKAGVSSNKVVVGVSSYGRSFAMAKAGCTTEDCLYTGTAARSNAAKGVCTSTAGYIANAEINQIIKNNPKRINKNYIDTKSNSRIVVYDNTQWVAFMDDGIRSSRASLYKGLNMGGTTNWASDLEQYNDAPDVTKGSWDDFKLSIQNGQDPYAEGGWGSRHGNWTTIKCTDPVAEDERLFTPQERWGMMDGKDAWSDTLDVWRNVDRPGGATFSESVAQTLHMVDDANCGTFDADSNCDQTLQCKTGGGSGAVSVDIWNSMVLIHEMHYSYYSALRDSAAFKVDNELTRLENSFAPVPPPPDNSWIDILLNCANLVGTVAVSSFFNTVLKSMAYFKANSVSYDNYKDAAKALVSFSSSLSAELASTGKDGAGWTVGKQADFSAYMGQIMEIWATAIENTVAQLFNGSDSSLILLSSLMGNGEFLEGSNGNGTIEDNNTNNTDVALSTLRGDFTRAIYAFAIPSLWLLSGTYAFVLDTGYGCSNVYAESEWLSPATQNATWGCYQKKLYYLVNPEGSAQTCSFPSPGVSSSCNNTLFSIPPGVETMDTQSWGGLLPGDLIAGAVKSYVANGNANGGPPTDLTNHDSLDSIYEGDITTAGFIRIPVCTANIAFAAWNDDSIKPEDSPNYPCFIKPAKSDCGGSTFVDQTSDASPSVDDCRGIVKNIQGTHGEWTVTTTADDQHQIVQYGSCKFGIQARNNHGNVNFKIGAQDIVDIITDSINKFGGSGKVGAKGNMDCNGNVNSQDVTWGLY